MVRKTSDPAIKLKAAIERLCSVSVIGASLSDARGEREC